MATTAPPSDVTWVLDEWTSKGVMKFRWPADETGDIASTGHKWRSKFWKKLYTNLKEMAERPDKGYGVADISKHNQGHPFDLSLDFWRKVPAENIDTILESHQKMGVDAALLALAAAIDAYRWIAGIKLSRLATALAENQKNAWMPWVDDKPIDRRAHALVHAFDAEMARSYKDVSVLSDRCAEVIRKVTKEYSSIVNRAIPVKDEMDRFIAFEGSRWR